jgi:hypothetical protein
MGLGWQQTHSQAARGTIPGSDGARSRGPHELQGAMGMGLLDKILC